MKRREFLSLGLRAAMGAAVFSVVPLSVLSVSKAAKINEFYTWSAERLAWFYSAECRIFGADYFFGEWVEHWPNKEHRRDFRYVARIAFEHEAIKRARFRLTTAALP